MKTRKTTRKNPKPEIATRTLTARKTPAGASYIWKKAGTIWYLFKSDVVYLTLQEWDLN